MPHNVAAHQDPKHKSYDLFRNTSVSEHIHIEIDYDCMEVFKYTNMNSEFYANITTKNEHDRRIVERFDDLLFNKRLDTIDAYVVSNGQIANAINDKNNCR